MENKKPNQTGAQAQAGQQKPGFGANNQAQTGVRAPQDSKTTGAQKQNISGSQRETSMNSRLDQDLKKDDSRPSSLNKDRKI